MPTPLDPRAVQAVLDAMLRQNGAIPQGPAYNNPNFIMPGSTPKFNPYQLSNEGLIPPTSGNLPVPYGHGGLPSTIDPAAALNPQGGIDAGLSASAGPEAGMVEGAPAATAEAGAASGGMLSRILPGLAPLVPALKMGVRMGTIPGLVASAALANDPGHIPVAAGKKYEPANPSPDDTGFTNLLKGTVRGASKAASAVTDFFSKPNSARAAEAAALPQPDKQGHYTIEDALGLAPAGTSGGGTKAGTPFAMPTAGRDNTNLDELMKTVKGSNPAFFPQANESLHREMMMEGASKGLAEGSDPHFASALSPTAKAMLGLGQGMAAGDKAYKIMQTQMMAEALERQSKWAVEAAKQGTEAEKEKTEEAKEFGVKVHASRHGVLVESTQMDEDGKPVRILQPVDNALFGGTVAGTASALNPKQKVNVMGQNFDHLDTDPLGKEKMLLSQLQSSGQLLGVMSDPAISKQMQDADKIAVQAAGGAASSASALDKLKWDARRAVILQNLVSNPEFRQNLIDRVVGLHNATGTRPALPADALARAPDDYSPEPGEEGTPGDDWLSQLQNAQTQAR